MSESNEKIYKAMGVTGGLGIALGIIQIVVGLVIGILSIVSGATMIKNRKKILF